MNVIEQLKQDGIDKGLCRLWQLKLSRENIRTEELARLYFRGIDFCISKDFPTLDFLRDNFKGKCEPYGVFVDNPQVECNNMADVVLNGNCNAELCYSGFSVSRVFVRHTSKAKISAFGYAHLTIDVFDDSQLALSVVGTKARVIVNVYGNPSCTVAGRGVKVVHKDKETY